MNEGEDTVIMSEDEDILPEGKDPDNRLRWMNLKSGEKNMKLDGGIFSSGVNMIIVQEYEWTRVKVNGFYPL